ncbi:hypothetical protein [Nocardia cerradoensis]|uniref:hypothetical protein n=1 Tax=Nocardia cerradoensis TaxID=85688 RepID=UPI00117DD88F|nr:hypothetical protein [Nocardia cerradoensis]NKY44289.1 hypothetical protein [Nocardia cerradoensis]
MSASSSNFTASLELKRPRISSHSAELRNWSRWGESAWSMGTLKNHRHVKSLTRDTLATNREYGLTAIDALGQIQGLLSRKLIDISVAGRGKSLVDFLFTPNTIRASVTSVDDDLIFYWTALSMSIEIDVLSYGGYWWSVKEIATESYSDEGEVLPIDQLQYSLNHFSKEVEAANPEWRNLM